ncbi:ribosome biogenesis protein NOP53 isoform X1 [Centruroides vittatus]|uniref:ribosome biogenesis protein NOP53 isoform X1 n=1 Tax=Centruroides vittatus TaxID=120091 RepID=UPI003510C9A9
MEVTKKSSKARFSKNKKKGWKKHCNIDDVDEFLEDKRLEERSGGPVSEKPNDEIFFIDKDKEFNEIKIPSKKKDILDDLKCFSALKNPSKVLPPIHVNVIQPLSKKRNKISKNKNRLLKKQIKQTKVLHSEIKKENDVVYDIWSSKENNSSVEKELDKDLIYYINETTKKRLPKVPNHRYQKPSLLPAVEVPPPGASYNPEYIDHIKLLSEVVKNELEYEKDHKKIERALTEKFPTIDEAPTEKTWLEEMSQGLKTENTEDDEENDEVGAISRNPPVRFDDKKSKQKRRREKEMKEKLKEKKKRKLENKRINEIYRLRSIKKDLVNLEKKIEDKQIKKDERLIKRMYRPHTLSKYKYEAPDPEFNLGEELTGELRTIKVVGNILEDRYKSFQRRNIIEPRIRQKVKRKYKLKVFERK